MQEQQRQVLPHRAVSAETAALRPSASRRFTQQFEQAAADFDDLGHRFPAMRGLAEYNRGLALLGLARAEEAREAFLDAATYGDEKLAGLAAEQLRELGETAPPPAPASAWYGSVELGVGHDDNVALVDEVTLPVGHNLMAEDPDGVLNAIQAALKQEAT